VKFYLTEYFTKDEIRQLKMDDFNEQRLCVFAYQGVHNITFHGLDKAKLAAFFKAVNDCDRDDFD
ncbi:hypothetical protein, partial [Staphylococcus aureus]|uniref:hypothetical protein n=1 Tax=Staphylococcus aureus TaxID=1280 RepID=UPI001E3521FE